MRSEREAVIATTEPRPSPTARFCFSHPAHCIALGFGAGLSPVVPGTIGTFVAIPLALILWRTTNDAGFIVAVIVLTLIGVWAGARTSRDLGVDDHGSIVIDEIAAFLAMLYFVEVGIWHIAFAFVLFRAFDIVKPPPIRWVDAHVKGGIGVMADDFVAAAFALLVHELVVVFVS
ncbi:MAG TPA: phosphatidylglycerophosphatase A [Casimicrobiaceae bacterium]|nr:phosphatidylglycerophosphatase A [Casimicrobiaceae bacterium]